MQTATGTEGNNNLFAKLLQTDRGKTEAAGLKHEEHR